jgi:hypothetical protein
MVFTTAGGGANQLDTGYEIENSLRFNDGDSANLSRSISLSGSNTNASISFWLKRGTAFGSQQILFTNVKTDYYFRVNLNSSARLEIVDVTNGIATGKRVTNRLFRDPSAFYHIFIGLDGGQGTEENRVKLYVNGVAETSWSSETAWQSTFQMNANDLTHYVGQRGDSAQYFDGYISEFNYIDGTTKAHTDFGEFNDNGVWIPKAYSGSYGTNGFFLPFDNKGKIHSVTAVNDTHHETDQAKFGSTSIYFDGSGDELHVNDIGQLTFDGDFTVEFFAYLGDQGDTYATIMNDVSNNRLRITLGSSSNSTPKLSIYSSTWDSHIEGTSDIGDNAWHHCAIVRDNGTIRIFVDGTQETTSSDKGNFIDIEGTLEFGTYSGSKGFNGYLDEIRISNIARYTSNFTPTTSIFSDDNNTRLLIHSDSTDGNTSFTDSSGVAGGIGNDSSGNNNDFTSVNINTQIDQTTDTPTNNFATWNPLAERPGDGFITASEGNVKATGASKHAFPTIAFPTSGKWYVEVKFTAGTSTAHLGLRDADDYSADGNTNRLYYRNDGDKDDGGTTSSYGDSWTNSIISIAVNLDDNEVTFYKDGTAQNGGTALSHDASNQYLSAGTAGSYTVEGNFGNPSFSISSGNADANGYGNFEYAVPSGYYALCTKNLAEYG